MFGSGKKLLPHLFGRLMFCGVCVFGVASYPKTSASGTTSSVTRHALNEPLASYKFEITALYDSLYIKMPNWQQRISSAVAFLNETYRHYGMSFKLAGHSELNPKGSISLGSSLFEELAKPRKKQREIILWFSGQRTEYVSGLAQEKHGTAFIGADNAADEKNLVVHEVGHLFGLPHIEDASGNFMSRIVCRGGCSFLPEQEQLLTINRIRDFSQPGLPRETIRQRIALYQLMRSKYDVDYTLYDDLGDLYYDLRDFSNARTWYFEAFGFLKSVYDPFFFRRRVVTTFTSLADSYFREGSFDEALVLYKRVLEIEPESARTYIRMAQVWSRRGNRAKAILNYLNASVLEPENQKVIKWLEWQTARSRPNHDLKQQMRQIIKTTPANAQAWFVLGLLNAANKDWPEASECFGKCLEIEPRHPAALKWIGKVRVRSAIR